MPPKPSLTNPVKQEKVDITINSSSVDKTQTIKKTHQSERKQELEVVHRENNKCCSKNFWVIVCAFVAVGLIFALTFIQRYFQNRRKPELDESNTSCLDYSCKETASEILRCINESVNPCDDFYAFACQGWQKWNPRPEYTNEWGVFDIGKQKATKLVIDILNEPLELYEVKAVTYAKRFFFECKNHEHKHLGQESNHFWAIWNKLYEYGGWPILYEKRMWSSNRFDLIKNVVALRKEFEVSEFLDVSLYPDPLGIPARNSILLKKPTYPYLPGDISPAIVKNSDASLLTFKDLIVNVSTEILTNRGKSNINKTKLEQRAFRVLEVVKLVSELYTRDFEEKNQTYFNSQYTVKALQAKLNRYASPFGGINIARFLNEMFYGTRITIDDSQLVTVPSFQYLLEASLLMTNLDQEDLANYLQLSMILQMIPLTSIKKLREYQETLMLTLEGVNLHKPRDEWCARLTEKKFWRAFGYKFVQRNGDIWGKPALGKYSKIHKMFGEVKQEYSKLVTNSKLPYIDKQKLLDVLSETGLCPGYPLWLDKRHELEKEYDGLDMFAGDNQLNVGFLEQNIAINKWATNKWLGRLTSLSLPHFKKQCSWSHILLTTGMFFEDSFVYAPLVSLKPPFYDENLPSPLNYGKLGVALGHEIAHALYGEGWSENKDGTSTPLVQCFVDQYSRYKLDRIKNQNLHVNGTVTLQENLSDNAGLLAAYNAYKLSSDGKSKHRMQGLENYTNDQLFFISFAQKWCENLTNQRLQVTLQTDVHSPGQFRVLGALQNSKEFADAWNCPVGSNMNPREFRRCTVF